MKTEKIDLSGKNTDFRWAIRPLVPREIYTDREEHLEYLYKASLDAIGRRTMSTVLLGQRRMGKTEIFKRVVNTLFFGQDNYEKGNSSIVPVYYSFRDTVIDRWMFATEYVENFLRWYTAFRIHDPFILSAHKIKYQDLVEIIRTRLEITPGIQGALNIFEELHDKTVIIPEKDALWLPRRVSDV